jgi:hypothetical protein
MVISIDEIFSLEAKLQIMNSQRFIGESDLEEQKKGAKKEKLNSPLAEHFE